MSARAEVLARIRGALADASVPPPVPRAYRTVGEHAPGSALLLGQLVDRLEDYKALVVTCEEDDEAIGTAIARTLSEHGLSRAVVPPGLPGPWTAGLGDVVSDDGTLTPIELDIVPVVVTGSVVAIAETGTIALDGGPLSGRRVISLVPDTHVCVVRRDDVVQTVPEALGRLDPTRPLTLISGPSATSDIELSRVEGVHGPRNLIVILAGGPAAESDR